MSLEADQLPDLREPKLIFAPLQILLGLCVGVYITFPLLGPWRLLMYVLEHHGLVPALVVAAPCYLFYGVQYCLAVAITKWVVVFRFYPCAVRIGSFHHVRWWFIDRLVCYGHLLFLDYLRGTPYLNIFYNLLGARISLSAYLDTVDITGYDLVEIQANSVVLSGAGIHAHSLEEGELVFGTVTLHENTYVGPKCLILPDTVINPNAVVRPMTLVKGLMVQGVVEGSPPRPVEGKEEDENEGIERGPITIFFLLLLQPIGLLLGPGLSILSSYPAFRASVHIADSIDVIDLSDFSGEALHVGYVAATILAMWGPFPFHVVFILVVEESQAIMQFLDTLLKNLFVDFAIFGAIWIVIMYYLIYSFCLMISAAIVKWVFMTLGPKPETISVDGPYSFILLYRRWMKERLMVWVWYRAVLIFLGSEVSSMWMRICGGKVGFRTVFAKIDPITDPDLLDVGWDCHFGDGSMSLGALILPGGAIDYGGVKMDNGALIGMHGLLLPGCDMGEECILGALSLADRGQEFQHHSIYFGTPASPLFLQKGQSSELERRSRAPRFYLYMFLYPFVIISMMMIDLALGGYVGALTIVKIRLVEDIWLTWILLPFIFGVFGFSLAVIGIFNKWLFVFRFKEFHIPVFSSFFYRRSLGMAMSWLLGDVFTNLFVGTPLFLLWLRLLGARLSDWRTYIESTFFTEPDLMTIGGKCLIERSVLPFCHVMESGWLTGKRVSLDEESRVGCHSVLLPEVKLSEGTVLSSFSCAAKAEVLPPFTLCSGCPVSEIISRLEGREEGDEGENYDSRETSTVSSHSD